MARRRMTAQRALELLQQDTDSDESCIDSEGDDIVLTQYTMERGDDVSHNNDIEDDDTDTTEDEEDKEKIQPLRKRIKGKITSK